MWRLTHWLSQPVEKLLVQTLVLSLIIGSDIKFQIWVFTSSQSNLGWEALSLWTCALLSSSSPPVAPASRRPRSQHGSGQMLHARCALAYRRGGSRWDLPAPPVPTPSPPPPRYQGVWSRGRRRRRWRILGGGGILWEVNWSTDQAVEERGKVPQVGQARVGFFAVTVVSY